MSNSSLVLTQYPQTKIIAADTFVVLANKILEKPRSLTEAREMLRLQSGNIINVHTGLCCLNLATGQTLKTTVKVEAEFRQLSDNEIDQYVINQPVLTWSAAFSPAYDSGMALIAWVSGSLTSFTHGLPIELVLKFLATS